MQSKNIWNRGGLDSSAVFSFLLQNCEKNFKNVYKPLKIMYAVSADKRGSRNILIQGRNRGMPGRKNLPDGNEEILDERICRMGMDRFPREDSAR